MIFLDDLSHWFISVNQRNFINNVHFCCSIQSTEWDVLLCTSHQPFPISHVWLQYSLLNKYSTFGWLSYVGRDTWGKNSACYQWVRPWLCNEQNWLRVSLLSLILSFQASKTVSIIVCWHFCVWLSYRYVGKTPQGKTLHGICWVSCLTASHDWPL